MALSISVLVEFLLNSKNILDKHSKIIYFKFKLFNIKQKNMKTTKKYGKKQDLALSMWVKLARAYTTFSKKSLENIRSFHLTEPQFSVLESLGHLGPLTIGTLCSKQLVSGGNMTLVVDNLEKEQLVQRIYSKEDRRTIIVQLTPKGQLLFDEIFSRHAAHIEKLASILPEKEQEELARLLKKLGTGLSGTK